MSEVTDSSYHQWLDRKRMEIQASAAGRPHVLIACLISVSSDGDETMSQVSRVLGPFPDLAEALEHAAEWQAALNREVPDLLDRFPGLAEVSERVRALIGAGMVKIEVSAHPIRAPREGEA